MIPCSKTSTKCIILHLRIKIHSYSENKCLQLAKDSLKVNLIQSLFCFPTLTKSIYTYPIIKKVMLNETRTIFSQNRIVCTHSWYDSVLNDISSCVLMIAIEIQVIIQDDAS